MTESQMLEAFSAAIEAAGGVRGFARFAGVSPSYVSQSLRGNVAISNRLLHAAGIERVVTYRRFAALLPSGPPASTAGRSMSAA